MYEPSLTPRTTMDPVPRVQIVFTTVPAGTERATVFRLGGGRTLRVRGGIDVVAAGGFSLVDTEAPFNVSLTYRAELFDAAGVSLGYTGGSTVILPFVGTVLHQPLDPERSASVEVGESSAESWSRPFEGELARPAGRIYPVWVGFGRRAIENLPFKAYVFTDADNAAVESMFGDYGDDQIPILCVRSSLKLGIPQPFFGLVQEPVPRPVNYRAGREAVEWSLPMSEAAAPVEALLTAIYTAADLEAAYATAQDLESAYLTALDMESDYSLAGTA